MGAQCGRDNQGRIHETVPEQQLPACVRDVLNAARAARPGREVTCVAFQTLEGGRPTARLGTEMDVAAGPGTRSTLRAKDLLVLSVSVTETTFETVRTVTHVLVTLARRPGPPDST